MCAIRYERAEVRYGLAEDVANLLDDRPRFLTLEKRISQAYVNRDDIVDVPEDLVDEVCASWLRYDVQLR